ncbi:MAG: exosortase/archaeosortase family protein [Candidatus Methylacidiphilales bacterium]|nr:exosortase/archaeosortase family protein [Candidatus Methylacidiphilales bacterium]
MQKVSGPRWSGRHLPLVALLAAIAFVSTRNITVDAFGALCKGPVLLLLSLTGQPAVDDGHGFAWGALNIPWTRDCAGLNLLLVLLALFLWTRRQHLEGRSFWIGLASLLPLAVLANVLRILTLIGYRWLFFPEIEPPQLHYFIGFLWLVPFALLLNRLGKTGPLPNSTLELTQAAAAMALIAPLLNAAGHWPAAAAVMIGLAHGRPVRQLDAVHTALTAFWVAAAGAIAWCGIESLWFPWIVACPLVIERRWLASASGWACLAASCPLLILAPWGEAAAWGLLVFSLAWERFHPVVLIGQNPGLHPSTRLARLAALPLLTLPFVAPLLSNAFLDLPHPPASAERRELPGEGYELHLPDQAPGMGLLWFEPRGSDRHHALEVCLKYRGINLRPTGTSGIQTDGQSWFREFFLVDGALIPSHSEYLKSTLGFRKSPGIHLIWVGSREKFALESFDQASLASSQRLILEMSSQSTNQPKPSLSRP